VELLEALSDLAERLENRLLALVGTPGTFGPSQLASSAKSSLTVSTSPLLKAS